MESKPLVSEIVNLFSGHEFTESKNFNKDLEEVDLLSPDYEKKIFDSLQEDISPVNF